MLRIDAFYLYSTGHSIHQLTGFKAGDPFDDWFVPMLVAENAVQQLLTGSVFKLPISQAAGTKLVGVLDEFTSGDAMDRTSPVLSNEVYRVSTALQAFENVLNAELSMMDVYLVIQKRGYDTKALISQGSVLFPEDLILKCPEAVNDITHGCRCIAFELPTAAGFHLHRANESVLHRYYDAVMEGKPRPSGRNMGDYLKALQDAGKGDPNVRAALRDLKDLHRNPLIHPEHTLEDVDEALALLGSIHSVVVHMLRAIPKLPEEALAMIAAGANPAMITSASASSASP